MHRRGSSSSDKFVYCAGRFLIGTCKLLILTAWNCDRQRQRAGGVGHSNFPNARSAYRGDHNLAGKDVLTRAGATTLASVEIHAPGNQIDIDAGAQRNTCHGGPE